MTTHHDDAAPATSVTQAGVAASFPQVLARELELITARRRVVLGDEAGTDTATAAAAQVFANAQHTSALGLAFSGGGIRSATFNLGVLQALAENDLLKYVDYLSTVSGGGYIGSWLHGVMYRGHRAGRMIRR
jgi:predicted acylesterase/phospholipase RssA